MRNDDLNNPEELALDALLAASLRQPEETEPTNEEIREFLKSKRTLSAEAKAALKKVGPDAVSRLIPTCEHTEALEYEEGESAALYAAMNRKNASDRHDPKTEAELQRKRKEILERLKKKQGKKK